MGWEPGLDAGLCFVRSTGVRPVRYLQAEKVQYVVFGVKFQMTF